MLKLITIGLIILLSIMVISTPSQERFDTWILEEYEINCEIDKNFVDNCIKDEKDINFMSSHFRNAGLFASYEKNYKYDNGETATLRTLGVLGTLIRMNDGFLWEILN